MALTSAGFITAVTEIMRLGRTAWLEYRAALRSGEFDILMPEIPELSREDFEAFALGYVFRNRPMAWRTGGPLEGLFAPGAQAAIVDANAPPALTSLCARMVADELCAERGVSAEAFVRDSAGAVLALPPIHPSAIMTLKAWSPDQANQRWVRLGLAIARSSFSLVAAQPSLIGINGRAETIVNAVGQSVLRLVDNDAITHNSRLSFGERAVHIFVQSVLETVSTQPELVIEEPHLAALAKAVIEPLHAEVAASQDAMLPAMSRLNALLRGPIAMGALQSISEHSDAFLKGDLAKDEALGAVIRAVLTEVVTTRQTGFDLAHVLGPSGVNLVFNAALETARDRPELFVRGQGANTDVTRSLLRGVAGALRDAPRPFKWDGELAPQLAVVGIDVASAYLQRRLSADPNATGWDAAGADVATHLIGEIMEGLKAGLVSGARFNPMEHLFTRTQAVEIVKIIALRAVETPGMIVGSTPSPELKNIATAVCRFIAADERRLLAPEDWRAVVGVALAEAAKNPGALFGIDSEASPERHLAVSLITTLLATAGEGFNEQRRPGALLFGETLREAMLATLRAAANSARALTATDADGMSNAVAAFVTRLNNMAAGQDRTLRMGASEWLYVYRWYIAHVVDSGRPEDISDDQIRAVLVHVPNAAQTEGAMQ